MHSLICPLLPLKISGRMVQVPGRRKITYRHTDRPQEFHPLHTHYAYNSYCQFFIPKPRPSAEAWISQYICTIKIHRFPESSSSSAPAQGYQAIDAMSAAELNALISRLEAVATRLESTSGGAGAASGEIEFTAILKGTISGRWFWRSGKEPFLSRGSVKISRSCRNCAKFDFIYLRKFGALIVLLRCVRRFCGQKVCIH